MKNIKDNITWERLSEIATNCLHALYEAEPIEAMEYFKEELDLTDEEREYFGVPTEMVYDNDKDYDLSCEDCPYHWADDGEDYPSCHYNGEDGYAPCSSEEPEEIDYDEYV